jgi:hypothetical protein
VWLSELTLPDDESDTVTACLRQIDFLTGEITHVDQRLARHALKSGSPDVSVGISPPRERGAEPAEFEHCQGDQCGR